PEPISDRPRDRVAQFSNNDGSGLGLGLRGGLLWKLNDRLNLAIAAALPFDITVDGETYMDFVMPKYPDLLIDETNLTAEDLLFVRGEAVEMTSDFEAKIKLPPSMSLGLAYQVTDKLLVALDAEYTLWSRFDGLEFEYSNFDGVPMTADTAGGFRELESAFFTSDLSNPVEWDDAGKVMLGMLYDWSEVITLMAGGSVDQSPLRTGQITPHFMDTGDKYGFNGGVTFHFDRWDLGFVQSYVSYDELNTSGFGDLNDDDKFDNFPGQFEASYYETILSIVYRF
ncbi:hypothetical protein GF377_08950, partial [candidate division GN15 bacterium]|nr:hypothetical protein [candidate division GN15 bacterium]